MSNKFDKVAYQREYMRKRRAKQRGDAESTVCTGMPERENDRPTVPDAVGEIPTHATSKAETLARLREMVKVEEGKPHTDVLESTDTRSRSDIAMGIWRNDQGGVISKFAYDKLQKMKEHAKENNFEMDDYSQ